MLYDYYALLGRNGHDYNDYYVKNGILNNQRHEGSLQGEGDCKRI